MAFTQSPRYPHQQQEPGIEYIVVQDYVPQDVERCIACLAQDVIFVKTPFIFNFEGTPLKPIGWLFGLNLRTKKLGYVPASFVEYKQMFPMPRTEPKRPLPLAPVSEESDDTGEEEPPAIPPPIPSRPGSDTSIPIEHCEWYFGKISKEEVYGIMQGTITGTFLVRDSSNPNDGYTLTLRKDDSNKLIRINREGSKFGFSSPCEFNSVAELINFHKTETLARYNSELDVCLLYPASLNQPNDPVMQPEEIIKQLANQLQESQKELIESTNRYEDIYHEFNIRQQRIQHKKTAIDAYNKTIEIFRDQCQTLEEHMNKSNRDEERLIENFRRLQIRLQDISDQRKRLQTELDEDIKMNRERDPQLTVLKHKINEIKRDQEECMKRLKMYEQVPESELRRRYLNTDTQEEEMNFIDEKELAYRFPDHAIMENWYFNDFGRADADKLLAGQQDGTFLIRPSTAAPYACSLICKLKVHHCLIKKTEEGYGFAEPFNLHSTLNDLVLHYAANSLLPHNDNLDTKLNFPARLIFRNR